MIYFYLWCNIVFSFCHFCIAANFKRDFFEWNLSCRDNTNSQVDWWYIYKPPKNCGRTLDFTFITSKQAGRLSPSRIFIHHNSMLQLTLAPLYSKALKDHMAVMSYGERESSGLNADIPVSTASGILFGNKFGGVWISHTLPGFPNLTLQGLPLINDEDYRKGHMFMCLTLNLKTFDAVAAAIEHTESKIIKLNLPHALSFSLPNWARMERAMHTQQNQEDASKTRVLNFATKNETLEGIIFSRGPEDSRCIYSMFAKLKGIVLDVYNYNNINPKPLCFAAYSLRYIESISLNFPHREVCYIRRRKDEFIFGVSTWAPWQRSGRNPFQHWVCTGNHDPRGYLMKGSLLSCVNNYDVWFAFDNLKTKEPDC